MPAVLVEIGPAAVLVEQHRDLADALASALQAWTGGSSPTAQV